jgi:hypothetical protein
MNTIPTSFPSTDGLVTILDELTTQANAVLVSALVVQSAHAAYAKMAHAKDKEECATVLREHGLALETDLGSIYLNAELNGDERFEAWTGAAASAAEMQTRKEQFQTLRAKMQHLEDVMADVNREMMGDNL